MDALGIQFFFLGGGNFHGSTTINENTTKTFVGKDLVKIRPAVAEQSLKKFKKKQKAHKKNIRRRLRLQRAAPSNKETRANATKNSTSPAVAVTK